MHGFNLSHLFRRTLFLFLINIGYGFNLTKYSEYNQLLFCKNESAPVQCCICTWNFIYKDTICSIKHGGNGLWFDFPVSTVKKICLDRLQCQEKGGTCHNVFCGYSCDFHKKIDVKALDNGILNHVTTLLDITSESHKSVIANQILQYVNNDSLNEIDKVRKALSVLMSVVFSNTEMEPDSTLLASKSVVKIMSMIANYVQETVMTCTEIKEIISSLFVCSDILLDVRSEISNNTFLKNPERLSLYEKVFQATKLMASFLENIPQLVSTCATPGGGEIMIQTRKSFLWVKEDSPHKFKNFSMVFQSQNSFFKISPLLASHLAQVPGSISVQLISTENNLFWWDRTSVNTVNQLMLSIKRKGDKQIKKLPVPIDLYFKNSEERKSDHITRGFAYVPPVGESTEDVDDSVSVYKLEELQLNGSGKVFITFHNMSDHRFKVLLLENAWPDFDMMTLYSKEVLSESPVYEVKLEYQTKDCIHYLGILPTSTAISDGRIEYSFEVKYVQCHSRIGMQWMSDGCRVGDKTSDLVLHCQCWHLSFFGGSVAISPRQIDLANDIKLLVNVKDNPKTFVVVTSVIMLYFMILVWTRHNDGKDRMQRFVIVLEDNFPGEEWAYLVTVYTGIWIGSGTDANVGFRLYGSKGVSRIHNLQSRQRKVLKANCDDWFLIFTPRSLGEIKKIHIFHDHSGGYPDWYCSKIMVYDLEGQRDFKFVIEAWISLCEDEEYTECFVEPVSTHKSLRRDRIALDNVMFGLRETHLLISIFTRHPRSSVTRSQRLSICVIILIVHMLTSIMFYELEEVEFPQYSSHKRHIIIGMESTLLASPFTFIVIFCFKKSRIVTSKGNMPLSLTSTQAVTLEEGLEINQAKSGAPARRLSSETSSHEGSSSSSNTLTSSSDEEEEEEEVEEEGEAEQEELEEGCWKNCYQQIQALLFQVITTKAMMPVKIAEEDEESSRVRKQWMYFAWGLCETAIFVSALFIVMYSLKMDQKKCNEWMQQSFRYSFANIFLMAPMKIIIFATILAILYGQLHYIASYECNTETAMNKKSMGNIRFLTNVLNVRKNPWYHPLSNKDIMVIRMQEKNWRRWRIIINFGVVILLYFVLTMEVLFTWDGLYIQTREHMIDMFSPKLNANKITKFVYYVQYLLTVVVPAIDMRTWYNGQTIMSSSVWKQEMGYLKDFSTRIMGYPHIRQQRVSENSCKVPRVMSHKFFQCNAPMTMTNMDKKEYSLRWTQPEKVTPEPNSPWVFSKTKSPLIICSYTTNKCYWSGGYMSKLDYNKTDTEHLLEDLFLSEWFDGLTRVVFFEMVLYNVNSELICYVTPMLEKLADGSFHLHVQSYVLHPRSSNFISTLFILLIFTFYYFLRIVLLFNRRGLTYLISWTGLLDIFLNALLHVTMMSLVFYRQARKNYLTQWQLDEEEDLQMNADIFLHRDSIRYETAILVIIIPAQVLHNFRFGKKYFVIFKILTYCCSFAFGLALLVLMYYFAFVLMGLINHYTYVACPLSRWYSTMSYYNCTGVYKPSSQLKMFTLPFCFITNLATYMMCVTAIYGYNEIQLRYRNCDDFNMFSFILEKLKHGKRRMNKVRRKFTIYAGKRFRAGADDDFTTDEEKCFRNRNYDYTKQMCRDVDLKFKTVLKKLRKLEKSF